VADSQIAAPQAVFGVAEEREPRGTSGIRFRTVMNAEDTANYILVYFDHESQCDLLISLQFSSGTSPPGCHASKNRRR